MTTRSALRCPLFDALLSVHHRKRHGRSRMSEREALRHEKLAALSPRYSPFLHVAIPPLWGGSVIAACVALVENLRAAELLVIPAMLVFANAFEWRIHRNALHKRWFVMPALFDRHTPI